MKNMPNMPATDSAWTRFAPETLRERKMRSGISGFAVAASRTTKAASSASETAPSAERQRRAPAVLGRRLDDRVDAEHQRGGDQHRAEDVGALAEADPAVVLDQPPRQEGGGEPDRDVDEEDPVPADRLGEDPADQQADRAAGGGDEAVDADRLGLLARLGEHRHDHAQDRPPRSSRRRCPARSGPRSASPGSAPAPQSERGPGEDRQAGRGTRVRRPIRSPSRPASSSRPPKAIR